jgi:thiamine-monophosphate kinase
MACSMGSRAMTAPPDEFAWIDSLKNLTRGDPRALGLLDDVAVLPSRPGHDMVISTDAMVEGVHFLAGEKPQIIARRLLRTSLSDLAAKGARPFGYFLTTAWPEDRGWAYRRGFTKGLADDGDEFGLSLLGGDTVSTSGPLTLSATVLGWSPSGGAILRSGARPGDVLVVCGVVGDGWLGLKAARGEIPDPGGRLASHYRTPRPLLSLREVLIAHVRAAADVSDGLLADAHHVGTASGCGVSVDLARLPLSLGASAWLADQADEAGSLIALATGGDDYALVCAVEPEVEARFRRAVSALGAPAAAIGVFREELGLKVSLGGRTLRAPRQGWRH